MKSSEKYRLESVAVRRIKRMPGLQIDASPKGVSKARELSEKRGYYKPVILSSDMTLLAGSSMYEACLEERAPMIPAVIVSTEGEADDLIFALQDASLDETPNAVAISAAIVRLTDTYRVPRKQIAAALGKSPAWLNKMENLCRKLNATVQKLVAEGQISARSAQEIARLPDDVQMPFAIATCNDFLSKQNVTYLVNRYLNEDTCAEERGRIINTPRTALPDGLNSRSRRGRDDSVGARLSRAVAGCLNSASYLSGLLDRIDIGATAVNMADIAVLAGALDALRLRIQSVFYPGKNPVVKSEDE